VLTFTFSSSGSKSELKYFDIWQILKMKFVFFRKLELGLRQRVTKIIQLSYSYSNVKSRSRVKIICENIVKMISVGAAERWVLFRSQLSNSAELCGTYFSF
jgi:hypothetical protein